MLWINMIQIIPFLPLRKKIRKINLFQPNKKAEARQAVQTFKGHNNDFMNM